jgi:hypothetical protein
VQVRAADLERAKATLSENKVEAASIDWDSVDIGEREDELPLSAPGRMPWLAMIGWLVAVAGLVAGLVLVIWWLARPPFGFDG